MDLELVLMFFYYWSKWLMQKLAESRFLCNLLNSRNFKLIFMIKVADSWIGD